LLTSGLVTQLHDQVYARLRHGRLALIGGPGAGKTAAMILLLLEALRYRERIPDATRTEVPVPVLLTLGSWNPGSQGLRDWVTATIRRNHQYVRAPEFGPDAAAQLFDAGRIALFLDGLDEMPDTQRGQALERLTAEAAGLRVVITSRPEEFRATLDTGRQLPYTAVVELQPVDPQAAAGYLLEGQIGVSRQRWQDVADHLLAHPSGVLVRTLNTPLTLSLARSAFTVGNPCELLTPEFDDEQALRGHLLDQVIVVAYPDPRQRAHASYWLSWLAHHMNTQPPGPTRDLSWWQIPGWISRWQLGLVAGIVFGLVGALVLVPIFNFVVTGSPLMGLMFGVVFGLVSGLLIGRRAGVMSPQTITIRRPTVSDLRSGVGVGGLVVWLVFALVSWGVLYGGSGIVVVLVAGLVLGLASGLAGLLAFWLVEAWHTPVAASMDVTPRLLYQRNLLSVFVDGSIVGLIGGLVIGLVVGLASELKVGLIGGLICGLMFGLIGGLRSAASSGAASSLRLAEIALRLKGQRVRFMPLLETALMRQVLRQAGVVYQFRHADLQDRLADQYQAGPTRHRAG
jgi:hypothetical protein